MKQRKALSFFVLSLFATLVLVTGANALVFTAEKVSSPSSVDQGAGSFAIPVNITYTGTQDNITVTFSGTITQGSATVSGPATVLNQNQSKIVNVNVNFGGGQTGNIAGLITATPSSGTAVNISFSVPINVPQSMTLTKVSDGTVRVRNVGSSTLNSIGLASSPTGLVFSPLNIDSLAAGDYRDVNVSLDGLKTKFGENSYTLTATSGEGKTASLAYVITRSFCKNWAAGSTEYMLDINSIDINNKGNGEDDSWDLLDEVEVEVEIENTGDESLRDVNVRLGLFDSSGKDVAGDLEFSNTDEDIIEVGTLNSGKDETVKFTFVVPADFEDGSYKLAIKTYSSKQGESSVCADESGDLSNDIYESVSVNRETDEGRYIAFDNIQVIPSEATCGDVVTITADVYNIGDEDQDRVRINLYNKDLGINTDVEITSGLDTGDKETVTFDITIPSGAIDKSYNMQLSSSYDYRSGSYRQESDKSEDFALKVIGCGNVPASGSRTASITARLDSDAKPGQEMTVRATITNLASQYSSFVISATDYESWAELSSISDRIVGLNPGESKEITLKFNVNREASGTQTFAIEAKNGNNVESRDVEVNLGAASAGGLGGINLGNNGLIWVIGAINVILIILIIIVAVRISRR